MKSIKYVLAIVLSTISLAVFPQTETASKNAITSEWETISLGKLQKKPRFKEPMISVRFMNENGVDYLHLSLKYMFTDAVFEEAVPVEYFKNEKIDVATEKNKYELKAVRYAKARRMNSVAQKTADIRVIFAGHLSFLKEELVQEFTVHYAQGYQNVGINKEEAAHLKSAYNKYIAMLPKSKHAPSIKIEGEAPKKAKTDTVNYKHDSLDKLRKQAKNWGR